VQARGDSAHCTNGVTKCIVDQANPSAYSTGFGQDPDRIFACEDNSSSNDVARGTPRAFSKWGFRRGSHDLVTYNPPLKGKLVKSATTDAKPDDKHNNWPLVTWVKAKVRKGFHRFKGKLTRQKVGSVFARSIYSVCLQFSSGLMLLLTPIMLQL
jgi:hypothetical protein